MYAAILLATNQTYPRTFCKKNNSAEILQVWKETATDCRGNLAKQQVQWHISG